MAVYEGRITAGEESCRECGSANSLEIARLRFDRPWSMENSAILCAEHRDQYYAEFQPYPRRRLLVDWRYQVSPLLREERAGPLDAQWGLMALDEARKVSGL